MEAKIKNIVKKYGSDRSYLVPILQDVQKEFNYLPQEALEAVCTELGVSNSRVYEVATFYKAFSLKPRGRHHLMLCLGTACHVRGASMIDNHIQTTLGLKSGETSADMEFTFETVGCLGACALGPILVVDGEYHGHMNIAKTTKILKNLGKKVEADDEKA
ncbi:MAG: NADP-reducing hydrogenase subunit HndA [Syntrophaceae bacterium PtaU1.Bin231]|nr:MAG: NADP-reducing hydrogenase subunit HndA [Syntrophaceae bacterium PtaU1.Bin231]HOG18510.1 NADH-quinone oxidoreductase subunit NuoE [Syntrophales bacterium]